MKRRTAVGAYGGKGGRFTICYVPVFFWNTLQDLGPELREAVQERRVILTRNSDVEIALRSHSFSARSQGAFNSPEGLPTTQSSVQGLQDAGLTRL